MGGARGRRGDLDCDLRVSRGAVLLSLHPTSRAVGTILVAAFALRLLSNWWLTAVPPVLDGDALWYHSTATSLSQGLGYIHHFTRLPTAQWPPGYPFLLSIVYRLFGPDPAWAYLLNAFAGTLTCWLAGRIALAVGSPREQLLATALLAFLPSHVLFASLVMSETVFTTIMTALVLGAVTLVRRGSETSRGSWLLWGVGVGLASLVRAEAVVLLAAPPIALLAMRVRLPTIAAVVALAVAGTIAGELPWLVRNAQLFGRIVPVSTSFGRTFVIGHNPVADGDMNLWSPDAAADERDLAKGDPALDLAVDARLRDAGIRFMIENPMREVVLVGKRLVAMYRGDRVWGEWYVPAPGSSVTPQVIENLGRLATLYYWPLLALALPGYLLAIRPGASLVLPVTVLAWTALFTFVFYGTQRFHFPLMPILCVMAALTIERARRRVRGQR